MSEESPMVLASEKCNEKTKTLEHIAEFLDGMPVFNERSFTLFIAEPKQCTVKKLPMYLSTTKQQYDSQFIKTASMALPFGYNGQV